MQEAQTTAAPQAAAQQQSIAPCDIRYTKLGETYTTFSLTKKEVSVSYDACSKQLIATSSVEKPLFLGYVVGIVCVLVVVMIGKGIATFIKNKRNKA